MITANDKQQDFFSQSLPVDYCQGFPLVVAPQSCLNYEDVPIPQSYEQQTLVYLYNTSELENESAMSANIMFQLLKLSYFNIIIIITASKLPPVN